MVEFYLLGFIVLFCLNLFIYSFYYDLFSFCFLSALQIVVEKRYLFLLCIQMHTDNDKYRKLEFMCSRNCSFHHLYLAKHFEMLVARLVLVGYIQ